MPDSKAGEKFKVRQFGHSYESAAGNISDDVLDDSLRSFVDKGDSVFENEAFETGNGPAKTRQAVIDDIRNNLIARMKEENAASRQKADQMKLEHDNCSKCIVADIRAARNFNLLVEQDDIKKRMLESRTDRSTANQLMQELSGYADTLDAKINPQGQPGAAAAAAPQVAPGPAAPALGAGQPGQPAQPLQPGDPNAVPNAAAAGAPEPAVPVAGVGQPGQPAQPLQPGDPNAAPNAAGLAAAAAPPQAVQPAPLPDEDDALLLDAMKRQKAFYEASRQTIQEKGTGHHRAYKFFHALGVRKSMREGDKKDHIKERNAKAADAKKKAVDWEKKRKNYRDGFFRQKYENFDKLALTYYEMTRSLDPGDGSSTGRDLASAQINAAKDIKEYTGTYNTGALDNFVDTFTTDPTDQNIRGDQGGATHPGYKKVTLADIPVQNYKDNAGAAGAPAAPQGQFIKSHNRMVMLDVNNKRFKMDAQFEGYRARRQFDDQNKLVKDNSGQAHTALIRAGGPVQRAGETTLVADRKGLNGSYLHSEKNSEILEMRKNMSRQRVRGIYLNGVFVSDDPNVRDKKDLGYFRNRSLDKQEKAEELRAAIRTSLFFQHVNAKTIQYYAGYNAKEDFELKNISERFDEVKNNPAHANVFGGHADNASFFNSLRAAPNSMTFLQLDAQKRGAVIAAYIEHFLDPANGGNNTLTVANYANDPVLAGLNSENVIASLCIALLSDADKPKLWDIARQIILDHPSKVSRHVRAKMHYMPEKGMSMRTELLNELVNNNNMTYGFEKDKADSVGADFFNPAHVDVWKEEANNRRGKRAYLLRNLLNGKLTGKIMDVASTTQSTVSGIQKAGLEKVVKDAEKERDAVIDSKKTGFGMSLEKAKKLDEAQQKVDAAKNDLSTFKENAEYDSNVLDYVQNLTDNPDILGIFGAGSGILGAAIGGEGGFNIGAGVFSTTLQGVDVIKAIAQFCIDVKKLHDKVKDYKDRQASANDPNRPTRLMERDQTLALIVFEGICKLLKSLERIVSDALGMGGTWVGDDEVSADRMSLGGKIMKIIKNTREFIENVIKATKAGWLKSRLDKEDAEIESAITLSNVVSQGNVASLSQEDQENYAVGKAAQENSQVQWFMALSRRNAKKEQVGGGFAATVNALNVGVAFDDIFNPEPISRTLVKLVPKAVEFIGWGVDTKIGRDTLRQSIGYMLGDPKYFDYPYFNEVLQRETGIISYDYLDDLARIFMSIDTHVLANDPNAGGGEKALLKRAFGTVYKNVDENNMDQVELKKLLALSGFPEGGDWRQVLRSSIRSAK